MESDDINKVCAGTSDAIEPRGAVNATILDYYKKFGRKRDLEQFFSLSTAQSDIKDTSGLFWRKMKNENDSSDSGDRKSDSSHEVCRISIRCSLPDPSSSQDDDEQKTKTESPHTESPPIITEEVPADTSMRHTDDEFNFDDNNSQKSLDALLDLSAHKPLSPTSSITSQRKLEWDSLADVGYGNESDRKNSASSLSTLERLALKQQYSNNDSKQDIGAPTSHSTPLDENDGKSKHKKGLGKKTKIYKKDVDFVEVNVPHSSDTNQAPSINVNLTKHISFNVEKDGGITIDNIKKDVSVSPEKISVESTPYIGMDKEIQTSLTKDRQSKEKSNSLDETPKTVNPYNQKIPVMISLNTLRKRLRRKKFRNARRRLRTKKEIEPKKDVTPQEKSGEQLSEAESFEYMPGHMYHQNQIKDNQPRPDNSTAGNKSSLESSGPLTTDSSKGSNHSLTKDLEKCVELLKVTLQKRYDDGAKKKLIKDIVQRLINSKYRDDETTTEFLSGLTFDSKKLAKRENNTTTSTSDANNTEDSSNKKPKKSILRNDKFNPNVVASTSQSAPNLFSASSEKVNTNLMKALASNTDSDVSSRGKTSSSENAFPRTSSEELYLKYLEALRREEAYKRHLKDKEKFLKQKLVSSETAFKVPISQDAKVNKRLKDLMKDLTRNNYDDGSGDASKLEGGSSSNIDFERFNAMRNQRSHSVFTLSSSHSECQKRPNLKKKMQAERESGEAGPSKHHYCCCPHHYLGSKVDCVDSSVQVSIKPCEEAVTKDRPCQTKPHECLQMVCECKKCKPLSPKDTRVVPDNHTGEIKYVCLCNGKQISSSDVGDNFMIYKCSKLTTRGVQLEEPGRIGNTGIQCASICNSVKDDKIDLIQPPCQMHTGTESSSSDNTSKHGRRQSKSSQTNMVVNMCLDMRKNSSSSSEAKNLRGTSTKCIFSPRSKEKCITVCEATRCLQTEISINPQISDPQLSDINIVGSKDCARLISENRRKVSFHSSDSEGGKSFSDVCTNSTSGKLLIQSAGSVYRDLKSKISEDKEVPKEPCEPFGKDYTIPIQGTNMTLRVNLTGNNKKVEQVNECIDTDNITFADVASSAIEENKSTQCSGIILCKCTNSQRDQSCKICTKEPSVFRKFCFPKKFLTESSTNCNTFPKIDVSSNKPSLKRANTDTGKLTICSCVQTDCLKAKYCEPNNNQPVVICNDPINQVITCDNSCQVEKYEENSKENNKKCECKDQITNRKCDSCNTTIKINIGIQKDFYDDKPNKECEEPKPECEKPQEECDEPKIECEEPKKERNEPIKECKKPKEERGKPKEERKKPKEEREKPKEEREKPKEERGKPKEERGKPKEEREKPKEEREKPKEERGKRKEECEEPKEEREDPKKGCEKPKEEREKPKEDCEEPKKEREDPKKECEKPKEEREKPKEESEKPKEECEEPEKECEDLKRESEVEVGTEKAKIACCCCVGYQTEHKPPKKDRESKNVCCCCVGSKTGDKPCKEKEAYCKSSCSDSDRKKISLQSDTHCYSVCCPGKSSKGPVLDMIQDITRRYSKTEMIKMKKNKCFSEIITVLNYLLETEDSTDPEPKICCSTSTETKSSCKRNKSKTKSDGDYCSDKCVDKSVQLSCKNPCQDNKVSTESSDIPCSSDLPTTSSNSAACKVLNRIKKECEKYHQKVKCRGRKCEVSSSTSVNCEKCKKVHYCGCRSHKCKRSKAFEKLQKKCIAYNLIIQTSESMLSEETVCEKKGPPLKNIIVRVPKRKCEGNKEGTGKGQESCRPTPRCSPRCSKNRSRSCPDECETSDEYPRRVEVATVREYLEQNRPDFVEKTSQRQHCLKFFSERRTQARCAPSLKMVVVHKPRCTGKVTSTPVYCGGVYYKRCDTVQPCSPCETDPCVHYMSSNPCDQNPCNRYYDSCKQSTDSCNPCYSSCNPCVEPCKTYSDPCKPSADPCNQCFGPCKPFVDPCKTYSDPCNPCVDSCNSCFHHCQECVDPCNMRSVHERFANERAAQRDLLSLHVEQQPDLTNLSSDELRQLAKQIGLDLRKKKSAPKFINEREFKKHSERIYKTLPEVVQKKEEKRKENIKKTNLLMANIFKKNLQKQALRGSVNLSNYNSVIKI